MKLGGRNLRSLLLGTALVAIGAVAGAGFVLRQTAGRDNLPPAAPLVEQLKSSLIQRNRAIKDVSIRDMRPIENGSPKHLVVARGVTDAPESKRGCEDELFGVFIFDASSGRLENSLEIIPTPRLMDTEMRIEKLLADEFEVVARSQDLGHVEWRREYRLQKR